MKIIFYNNTSRFDRLDKTNYLSDEKILDGVIFKTIEDTNDIIIRINNIQLLSNYNYCYIEDLNSYYFIVERKILNNQIIELTLHNDLLMSKKNDLLKQNCIIARQENIFDAYLNDPNIQIESYARIQTKLFPHSFTNTEASYILVLCGNH